LILVIFALIYVVDRTLKRTLVNSRIKLIVLGAFHQRCAGAGVRESIPARVGVFQQEQDQEWIFSIGKGAGVVFILLFLRY